MFPNEAFSLRLVVFKQRSHSHRSGGLSRQGGSSERPLLAGLATNLDRMQPFHERFQKGSAAAGFWAFLNPAATRR
jgi:hypothetical protein